MKRILLITLCFLTACHSVKDPNTYSPEEVVNTYANIILTPSTHTLQSDIEQAKLWIEPYQSDPSRPTINIEEEIAFILHIGLVSGEKIKWQITQVTYTEQGNKAEVTLILNGDSTSMTNQKETFHLTKTNTGWKILMDTTPNRPLYW